MSKQMAHLFQSNKLLEESEGFLSSLNKTAERILADSTHHMNESPEAPNPSLADKQNDGKTSSAGAGKRSTEDLFLRPTTIMSILKLYLAHNQADGQVNYETSLQTDCRKERARGVEQIKLRQVFHSEFTQDNPISNLRCTSGPSKAAPNLQGEAQR
jgi:hypothetical protein